MGKTPTKKPTPGELVDTIAERDRQIDTLTADSERYQKWWNEERAKNKALTDAVEKAQNNHQDMETRLRWAEDRARVAERNVERLRGYIDRVAEEQMPPPMRGPELERAGTQTNYGEAFMATHDHRARRRV